jgi:hypothetical protein
MLDAGGARGVRPGVSTTSQPLASQPDLHGELMHERVTCVISSG